MPDLSLAPSRTGALEAADPSVVAALVRLGVTRGNLTQSERVERMGHLLRKLASDAGVPAAEMHIVLEGALGTPPEVIAQQYKVPVLEVQHTLSSPLVLLLQRELAAAQAEGLADPMKRVEAVANEMLDVKLDLVRKESTHPRLRNEIASDLLDRGGVRKPTKVQADIYARVTIDSTVAAGLREALKDLEVAPATIVSYKQHLLSTPAPAADERELVQRPEQPSEPRGASPTTSDAGARPEGVAA